MIRKPTKPSTEGLTTSRASVPVFKEKKCDARRGGCGLYFTPTRPMQPVCAHSECRVRFVTRLLNKKTADKAKAEKAQTRAAREALKTIPMLKKEAQVAFNKWIRQRDAAQPCISCGAPPPDLSQLHAGRDAGHYRSTGAADHLRFNEDNCHAQCVRCNQWGAGMVLDYRLGLFQRIGSERVEALEANNEPVKWTREELRALRDKYRLAVRQKGTG